MKTRMVIALVLLLPLLLQSPMAAARPSPELPLKEGLHSDFDCATVSGIPKTECDALVALYNATGGENWKTNTGWLQTTTPCSWYGVGCETEHVIRLNLDNNQLNGVIPPEIGALTNVTHLYLGRNQLTTLPPEIGALTSMITLSIYDNQLAILPPEIGALTNLTKLYLGQNQLTTLPPEIGALTNLTQLFLGPNQLTTLPLEIGALTNLTQLMVFGNQMATLRPEIGNLVNLTWLDLSGNQLVTLPPEIGNLNQLTTLSLSDNQLTALPPEIGDLAGWLSISLDCNELTSLPPQIGNIAGLWALNLHDNKLTGLPAEIGNLSNLWYLNLAGNQLTTLPGTIGSLGRLNGLYVYDNELTTLPSSIGNLSSLETLSLFGNQLTTLPAEIGNLATLRFLYLYNNLLSGEVPATLTSLNLTTLAFNDTGWCAPPSGPTYTWLAGIPYLFSTGVICDGGLGTLSGTASLPDDTPAAGVQVDLYRSLFPWQYIQTAHTAADGQYQFTDLGQGLGIDYRVRFVDPAQQLALQYYDTKATIATATVITITPGVPRTGIDAVLAPPQPPAVDVETDTGSVVFNPDGTAQIMVPRPNPSDITITRSVTCTAGSPTTVTLLLSTGPQYAMNNVGGDAYQATIPAAALTANATLSIRVTCGVTTTDTIIGYITLYDPSGIVSDKHTNEPIAGAMVMLYQVPGWEPKTGPDDDRPNTCESNLSKDPSAPWSQPAPTELGIVVNPDVTVTAPKIPYQQTTVAGYYGWDVPLGCWYVTVTAEGYTPLVSPVVGVPPEVTDLHLALTPVGGDGHKVFLPLALRSP